MYGVSGVILYVLNNGVKCSEKEFSEPPTGVESMTFQNTG